MKYWFRGIEGSFETSFVIIHDKHNYTTVATVLPKSASFPVLTMNVTLCVPACFFVGVQL